MGFHTANAGSDSYIAALVVRAVKEAEAAQQAEKDALYEKDRCPCGGSPMWVPFEDQRHLATCTELEDFMRSIGASR